MIDELKEVKRNLVEKESEVVESENRERELKSEQVKTRELEVIFKETINNLTFRLNFVL